jgi:hypothetical protein
MEFEGKLKVSAALDVLMRAGIDITRATLIEWCKKHGLGIQLGSPNGPWLVDMVRLARFIKDGTHNSKQEGGTKAK